MVREGLGRGAGAGAGCKNAGAARRPRGSAGEADQSREDEGAALLICGSPSLRHPEVRGEAAPRRMIGRGGATSVQVARPEPSPFEARPLRGRAPQGDGYRFGRERDQMRLRWRLVPVMVLAGAA